MKKGIFISNINKNEKIKYFLYFCLKYINNHIYIYILNPKYVLYKINIYLIF